MTGGSRQKLKMLYLKDIFIRETDEEHPLTMAQIIRRLEDCGVNAERKALYLDLEELRSYGLDIIGHRTGCHYFYYLGARDFELPELKLLVDSVQSAKFITEKKSRELIQKLESLVSRHQALRLHRQVFFRGRIKTMNESIYYNVDRLHEAIGRNRRIRFKYFRWNLKKELELRRDGTYYDVSPWCLIWDDEYYYLVAFDSVEHRIKHFRVDKMLEISLLDEPREGRADFSRFDLPAYDRSLFGMFGGEDTPVLLEARNDMIGVLIDRFGKDIPVLPAKNPGYFRTSVNVAVSGQFLGWIMAVGSGVHIAGPEKVVTQMKHEICRLAREYAPVREADPPADMDKDRFRE
ncbi:MAG: WYL domain-containing protein [Eubacteriales bacterium]|nr:WYL domain-containing protein [Eubacteriales bacterium]